MSQLVISKSLSKSGEDYAGKQAHGIASFLNLNIAPADIPFAT